MKKHLFIHEEIKAIVKKEAKMKSLIDHNRFRRMMCGKKKDYGFTGYDDTWFYCMSEELSDSIVATYETLRGSVQVHATKEKHKVTGQQYITYELRDDKASVILDICGYALIDE